jgi:hypothetical protein
MEDASGLVGLVRSHMGDEHMGLVGARARLIAAIDELKVATGEAMRQAIEGHEDRLRARLSPRNGNSPLHQIESRRPESHHERRACN